ncbi:MAG: hypothetical protein ABIB72_03530, partial [Candidatus Falkowbacteria bacterium]
PYTAVSLAEIEAKVETVGADYLDGSIRFSTSKSGISSEHMIIDEDGNVGIGTTAPGAKLDVNGDVLLRGNIRTSVLNDGLTFVGVGAGVNNQSGGAQNSFYGYNAGNSNTTGAYNTFLGYLSGTNSNGNTNTFVGNSSGYSNTTGYQNNFVGYYAGYGNTSGYSNNIIGSFAGYGNGASAHNNFIGYYAGRGNGTYNKYYNNFIGNYSGYNIQSGNYNNFLGAYAGYANTSGSYNNFLGYRAGYYNTTGRYNDFLGYYAGYANTTGNYNVYQGSYSGYYNNTGSNNVVMGYYANIYNRGGGNNTIIGHQAGGIISTHNSSGNVFLGYQAGYNETGSNKLYIANSSANPPLIYGDFATGNVGIGTATLSSGLKLDVEGQVGATQYCDQNGANCKSITDLGGGIPSGYTFIKTKIGILQFLIINGYSKTFNYRDGTMYHYCDFSVQNGVASIRARQDGGGWNPPQPCSSSWETDGDAYCQGPNGVSWFTRCTISFNSISLTACNACGSNDYTTGFGLE